MRSHVENETKTVIYKWNREERRGRRRRRRETRTRASQDVAVAVEVDALGLRANEGNWKGILCNLNRDGSPQELPPMYVPDALREWGETLYEWNTLCESLVVETNHDDGSTSNTLTQDVKRQVPLTACESVEIQFETIGRVSTEDFTCRADSEGNFVLASDQITVDNDTQSARFHACFHVSREKRVRFDILLQKYLTSSGAKHHVNVGKAYLEERIQGPLDEATLDKLYEQGLRETNEIANTTRPSEETALSFGVNPLAEDMETDERHVIGLPMDAWLDIYSSSSDPSRLCIGVNMQGAEGKVFSATMQYSDSVLISTSMS